MLALRHVRRERGFAVAAIVTLALGIGANTAVFSLVRAVLLTPLPYAHGDRLVALRQEAPRAGVPRLGVSVKELEDYRARATSMDALVEYHNMDFTLLGRGDPVRVTTGVVSWNFFDVLGLKPTLGRGFLPDDERHDADPVLLLGHDFWLQTFGGDPGVVGMTFRMNDRPHTVVGVLPPIPQYPDENDVYMPTSACPFRSDPQTIGSRRARMLLAFGRLRDGAALEAARAELDVIAQGMQQASPGDYPAQSGFGASADLVRDLLRRGSTRSSCSSRSSCRSSRASPPA
jgi:putative ABC transport system permease protein